MHRVGIFSFIILNQKGALMATESFSRVGFVILGCGYMGGNAVRAVEHLMRSNSIPDVEIDLVAVVTHNPEFHELAKVYGNEHFSSQPAVYQHRDDAISYLRQYYKTYNEEFPVIVYDATPPMVHFNNLEFHYHSFQKDDPIRKNLFYVGEKPLLIDPAQVYRVQSYDPAFNLSCNVPETVSNMFKIVKEYIAKNQLQVKEMYFWSAGSEGIRRAIGSGRAGIAGGALLDKSIPEFFLSLNLIGEKVEGTVRRSEILHLVPIEERFSGKDNFILTSVNKFSKSVINDERMRDQLPADGQTYVEVDWKKESGENIRAKYLFSWLGVTGEPPEREIIREILNSTQSLVFPEDRYILDSEECGPQQYSHPLGGTILGESSSEAKFKALTQDVKICILKCKDGTTIVCNFLEDGAHSKVQRTAYAAAKNGNLIDRIYEYRPGGAPGPTPKWEEMADVFSFLIRRCIYKPQPQFSIRDMTLECHNVLFSAHHLALGNISTLDFKSWIAKSGRIVRNKMIK